MIFLLGVALAAFGVHNLHPGVFNSAFFLALVGIGVACYGLYHWLTVNSEEIAQDHPDALGSLDLREREGHR